MSKAYRGKSDSQANAEALARRTAPYAGAYYTSTSLAFDWRKRQPSSLRDAVDLVRRHYADEVPTKLHEGYDSIGEGGTPKMTARAEGYLFGNPGADDAARDPETGERDMLGYYFTPFRAHLASWQRGDELARTRAAIVSHITIGSQGAVDAAIAEGAHPLDAKRTATDALTAFLHGLSDIRVHVRDDEHMDVGVTAA